MQREILIGVGLTVALLVIANLSARPLNRPRRIIVLSALGLVIVDSYLTYGIFFWPLLLQTSLLCLLPAHHSSTGRSRRFFTIASVGLTLLVYGLVALVVEIGTLRYVRLRDQHPFESIEERLPSSPPLPDEILSVASSKFLDETEEEIYRQWDSRTRFLRAVHENAVGLFVSKAGFGAQRVIRPSELNLTRGHREPLPQPGYSDDRLRSIDGPVESVPAGNQTSLDKMHLNSIVDFANPDGFGYFKDRRHVAGFLGHGFSRVPDAGKTWQVASIELVSLLREQPVVYVSENLPRMQELRSAARDLDEFERAGLEALKKGEGIYTRSEGEGLRMLGAIRSTKQCINCHGGERGDSLGAFSYILR